MLLRSQFIIIIHRNAHNCNGNENIFYERKAFPFEGTRSAGRTGDRLRWMKCQRAKRARCGQQRGGANGFVSED